MGRKKGSKNKPKEVVGSFNPSKLDEEVHQAISASTKRGISWIQKDTSAEEIKKG